MLGTAHVALQSQESKQGKEEEKAERIFPHLQWLKPTSPVSQASALSPLDHAAEGGSSHRGPNTNPGQTHTAERSQRLGPYQPLEKSEGAAVDLTLALHRERMWSPKSSFFGRRAAFCRGAAIQSIKTG